MIAYHSFVKSIDNDSFVEGVRACVGDGILN